MSISIGFYPKLDSWNVNKLQLQVQLQLTSCFSGTYLARSPQRIPKPMPPTMERGPCIIWKTRASGEQK
jgi:hypothetical protein